MPRYIRLAVRFGNTLLAMLGSFMWIFSLNSGRGSWLTLLFFGLVALAIFNIHVVEKAAKLLDEEEWLQAEIRKVALRQQLAEMQRAGAAPPPPKPHD